MSEREIRSFREKVQEEFTPKKFIIKTYGSFCSNGKPLILELDQNEEMWRDGVGRLKVGDEVVHFDIMELLNYLRVSVK